MFHFCFIAVVLFTQLASSRSASVSLDVECNNIVVPVGLDMSPSHFNRQTCGGAGAHYVIMLSGRLFILTSSSHKVTSARTAECINGRKKSSLTRRFYVLYPLPLPQPTPRTRPHQLLILPISRAALFTGKL